VPAKRAISKSNSDSPSTPDLASFESEFERLGTIVEQLENGSTTLDEMLKLYEEGITLAGGLTTLLNEAELRVEKLSKIHEELLEPSAFADDDETIEDD